MDGERRPEPKLGLGQVQNRSDSGKCEQSDRIEQEHGSERNGDLFFAGVRDWRDRGNGAATADGCGRRDSPSKRGKTYWAMVVEAPSGSRPAWSPLSAAILS